MKGRYDYSDEAEFDVLFLAPGAPTETSRARQLSARPDGDQVVLTRTCGSKSCPA
jgi:hypothetical protein